MCQYCANTGLCYFIIVYGGLWIYRKFVGILKSIKKRKITKEEGDIRYEKA